MEILNDNDLIRVAWTTIAFSKDSQRYAVKLLLRDGDLITLLTDYQRLYLDSVPLGKTFTAINAKLSAPDDVLLTKISDLFTSESAKSELSISDSVDRDLITINLENTTGKRNFKWKFEGRLVNDHGQSFYVHVVRPMLDMLSLAADLHRLEFLKDIPKLKQPKDPFSKQQVRKLYEIVTSSLDYSTVSSKLNDTTETNSLPDTPPPDSRKRATDSSDDNANVDQSESSLPPTPPPQETVAKLMKCEDDSKTNDDDTRNGSGDTHKETAEKSPAPKPKSANTTTPKKRKLRF